MQSTIDQIVVDATRNSSSSSSSMSATPASDPSIGKDGSKHQDAPLLQLQDTPTQLHCSTSNSIRATTKIESTASADLTVHVPSSVESGSHVTLMEFDGPLNMNHPQLNMQPNQPAHDVNDDGVDNDAGIDPEFIDSNETDFESPLSRASAASPTSQLSSSSTPPVQIQSYSNSDTIHSNRANTVYSSIDEACILGGVRVVSERAADGSWTPKLIKCTRAELAKALSQVPGQFTVDAIGNKRKALIAKYSASNASAAAASSTQTSDGVKSRVLVHSRDEKALETKQTSIIDDFLLAAPAGSASSAAYSGIANVASAENIKSSEKHQKIEGGLVSIDSHAK